MANKLILLKDPLVPGDTFYPVTMASAVYCQGTNQQYTLQYLVDQLENFNGGGGGGGGSTVTGNSITLSTTAQIFMTIDGSTEYTIKLPSTDPWAGNYAASSHAHGDITSSGQITSTAVTAASGQSLVVVSSNSIKKSAITLGSSTTQFLANNGTWVQPSIANISGFPSFSSSNSGQVLKVQENGTLAWAADNTGGGGGGGDTVTGKTVTLSTAGQAVIQVNSSDSGSVSLPSTITVGGTNMPEIAIGTTATTQQVAIASGDRLVITDNSNGNKLRASSISFNSTHNNEFLRKDGTWVTPTDGSGGGSYSAGYGIIIDNSDYIHVMVPKEDPYHDAIFPRVKDIPLPVMSLKESPVQIVSQNNAVNSEVPSSLYPDEQPFETEQVLPIGGLYVALPELFSYMLAEAEQAGVQMDMMAQAIIQAAGDYL